MEPPHRMGKNGGKDFMTMEGYFRALCGGTQAVAQICGSPEYPDIRGQVRFYQTRCGVLAAAEVRGLPWGEGDCGARVFGMHIHSGGACVGDEKDPFAAAMTHYNPDGCSHPQHRGDLPPLFGNHGCAFQVVLTDRLSVREILGKTVILHEGPDDFTTQPAGNAGKKIACGVVRRAGC